jgi:RND family efflux transporter MFP subunit
VRQGDSVFWVGASKPLRVTAEVEEEDIPLVDVGQKVLLKADAFPDQIIEGKVVEITPKGDPVDKNFRVRVSLPEDTRFMTGMTVESNIIVREAKNVLLVPTSGVREGAVFVTAGEKFERRAVELGVRGEEEVEIREGLREGEKILKNPERAQ